MLTACIQQNLDNTRGFFLESHLPLKKDFDQFQEHIKH